MKAQITVDNNSNLPKYQQIFDSVISLIDKGLIERGSQLPSITELAESQKIAKVTVARAYEILKQRGVILSRHGKGFYIASTETKNNLNIFLLFDNFNAYKETLYYSLKEELPEHCTVSLFFHHYDLEFFESIIKNNIGNYDYYVIMPHFNQDISDIVKQIPKDKLIIIDKAIDSPEEEYAAVYQDFENDIYSSLLSGKELLQRYNKLTLIKSADHFQFIPEGIFTGFELFKKLNIINCAITETFSSELVRPGEAFLFFADRDLISFIKQVNKLNLKLGKEIGLISYDDTPMKEILEGGITVISTDFEQMGKSAGKFITQKIKEKIANPSKLIIRKSL